MYPEALVRTCVVHLVRNSLAYASLKERRLLSATLKTIYRAATEEDAAEEENEEGRGRRRWTRSRQGSGAGSIRRSLGRVGSGSR